MKKMVISMKTQWLLLVMVLLLTGNTVSQAQEAQTSKPNIIIILADDLGYEAIGAYGGVSYQTPNIDQLAGDGIQFMNAHANPLCSPSRVKLLTGKSNVANYVHFGNLPQHETTLAHILKNAGYKTFMAGKWQLANQNGQTPVDAGFDETCIWDLRQQEKGSRYKDPKLHIRGGELQTYKGKYGPDLISQCAHDFIRERGDQPFFLFYSMLLTHKPFIAPPGSKAGNHQGRFHDMVGYMDRMVGQLLDLVEAEGIAEQTMIWFIGDNGTDHEIHSKLSDGRSIGGGKGHTTSNGTHVPFIVRWPGHIKAGAQTGQIIDFSNIFPTLEEITQQSHQLQPQYGPSLLGLFTGTKTTLQKDWVYIHYDPAKDTRELSFWGNRHHDPRVATYAMTIEYKLYADGRFYKLSNDLAEKTPLPVDSLSAAQQQVHASLSTVLEKQGSWDADGQ